MIPQFVIDKQRDALAHLEAVVQVLDEDGPTELAVAMAEASVREGEAANALYSEWSCE